MVDKTELETSATYYHCSAVLFLSVYRYVRVSLEPSFRHLLNLQFKPWLIILMCFIFVLPKLESLNHYL